MTLDPAAPIKRFYETAAVAADGDAFAVVLDSRTLRTPKRAPLKTPSRALAEAIAAEWSAQATHIHPATMPLTRLANVTLDLDAGREEALVVEIARYAGTDLVCHRAEGPRSLVERQADAWDPLLAWARARLGAALVTTVGVIAVEQPAAAIDAVRAHAQGLDRWRLTGLAHGVALAGSAVIGLGLAARRLDAGAAFQAAFLDDLFQLERWGEDAEARSRLDRMAGEFAALERWFALLDG